MKTFFSEEHRRHFPQAELSGGQFVTPYERPSRVEYVLARLKDRGLTDIADPGAPDMAAIHAMCAPDYLEFLENAWSEWKAEGMAGEIIAACFPARRMQMSRPPRNIDGKVRGRSAPPAPPRRHVPRGRRLRRWRGDEGGAVEGDLGPVLYLSADPVRGRERQDIRPCWPRITVSQCGWLSYAGFRRFLPMAVG